MKPLSSDGLLDVWLFDGKGGARRIPATEPQPHRPEEGGFIWQHFRRLPNRTDTWLHTHSGIDTHVVEELMETHTRPRCQVLEEARC